MSSADDLNQALADVIANAMTALNGGGSDDDENDGRANGNGNGDAGINVDSSAKLNDNDDETNNNNNDNNDNNDNHNDDDDDDDDVKVDSEDEEEELDHQRIFEEVAQQLFRNDNHDNDSSGTNVGSEHGHGEEHSANNARSSDADADADAGAGADDDNFDLESILQNVGQFIKDHDHAHEHNHDFQLGETHIKKGDDDHVEQEQEEKEEEEEVDNNNHSGKDSGDMHLLHLKNLITDAILETHSKETPKEKFKDIVGEDLQEELSKIIEHTVNKTHGEEEQLETGGKEKDKDESQQQKVLKQLNKLKDSSNNNNNDNDNENKNNNNNNNNAATDEDEININEILNNAIQMATSIEFGNHESRTIEEISDILKNSVVTKKSPQQTITPKTIPIATTTTTTTTATTGTGTGASASTSNTTTKQAEQKKNKAPTQVKSVKPPNEVKQKRAYTRKPKSPPGSSIIDNSNANVQAKKNNVSEVQGPQKQFASLTSTTAQSQLKPLSIKETLALKRSSMKPMRDYSSISSLKEISEQEKLLNQQHQHQHQPHHHHHQQQAQQAQQAQPQPLQPHAQQQTQKVQPLSTFDKGAANDSIQTAIKKITSGTQKELPENTISIITHAITEAIKNFNVSVGNNNNISITKNNNLNNNKYQVFTAKKYDVNRKNFYDEKTLKEKIKAENRERKKKWRISNSERNKDNDLRFRVQKRASHLFGGEDSEEKRKWIEVQFEKRKNKRILRELELSEKSTEKSPTIDIKEEDENSSLLENENIPVKNIENNQDSIQSTISNDDNTTGNKEKEISGESVTTATSAAIAAALSAANNDGVNSSHFPITTDFITKIVTSIFESAAASSSLSPVVGATSNSGVEKISGGGVVSSFKIDSNKKKFSNLTGKGKTSSGENSIVIAPPSKLPDSELTKLLRDGRPSSKNSFSAFNANNTGDIVSGPLSGAIHSTKEIMKSIARSLSTSTESNNQAQTSQKRKGIDHYDDENGKKKLKKLEIIDEGNSKILGNPTLSSDEIKHPDINENVSTPVSTSISAFPKVPISSSSNNSWSIRLPQYKKTSSGSPPILTESHSNINNAKNVNSEKSLQASASPGPIKKPLQRPGFQRPGFQRPKW
ncbi:hypothetical protein PACTADRAFT_51042 [Pachysolen tannophilus NRRL Y-2460]|uniref:DUF3020 domain-containing protein n=1 Tax=Pachysolen tannophilus NRRL Y-2460 TaxID=669874 RepID=A0A1E4TR69_PACTA|nr:hypothetical protein PACTADRAFT_51042 [Pachysolen tannophilus NRRL Y-2460]